MADKSQDLEDSITWQPSETAHPDAGSLNPYAPAVIVEPEQEGTDAELTRRKYLTHEVSVQSIGSLFILAALFVLLSFGGMLSAVFLEGPPVRGQISLSLLFALFAGCLYLGVGIAVRGLQPWSRWPAILLSALAFPFIPIGTILSIYFLYLLLSRKGAMVFSEQYAEVRAATPHIRYRTPVWLWGLLILFIAAIVLLVTLALSS